MKDASSLTRRQLLANAARTLPLAFVPGSILSTAFNAFAGTGASPSATRFRTIPNLDDSNILRFTAGLRPYRKSGLRIEREDRFGKTFVHNYGHGGAGITLSWGTAHAAVDLISNISHRQTIAVLGAGVVGLTTAYELRSRGYQVNIYAEKAHPNVTSSLAGGQWSPALVGHATTPQEQQRYQKIMADSFKKYAAFKGAQFGVTMVDNILAESSADQLKKINIPNLAKPVHLPQLPFQGVNVSGDLYRSWMIEPPIFLPALTKRLRQLGVKFFQRSFASDDSNGHSSAAVSALKESVVINCLGLGAKKLVADDDLIPVRGRLIHLNPNKNVDYLLLHDLYMFSRKDAIILGGTYDFNQSDLTMNMDQYNSILQTHRKFFGMTTNPLNLAGRNVPYVTVEYT